MRASRRFGACPKEFLSSLAMREYFQCGPKAVWSGVLYSAGKYCLEGLGFRVPQTKLIRFPKGLGFRVRNYFGVSQH